MADDAATTSSSPALGFASVVMAPSYQGRSGAPAARDRLLGDFGGLEHDGLARVLLQDRQETGVEEPDLEQHQEWQRSVDLVDQGVEHRGGEVEPERHFDDR